MLWTFIIIALIVLLVVSLFYRPFGTGYPSYAPSGIFFALLVIVLLLLLLHAI
jgi:hypothetical protein